MRLVLFVPRSSLIVLLIVALLLGAGSSLAQDASLPAYLEFERTTRLQATGDAAYDVTARGEQQFVANNPSQAYTTQFNPAGIRITPLGSARWTLDMSLVGYGSGDVSTLPAQVPNASGNRVEYRHEALVEWYVNGPLGVQQGFTLLQPPSGEPSSTVTLEFEVSGDLMPALSDDGSAWVFSNESGADVLRYDSLVAFDANQQTLPARLDLRGSTPSIVIETVGAAYPITVDPLVSHPTLLPVDPFEGDHAGSAMDARDALLVGIPNDDDRGQDAGAAYLYFPTGTLTWQETAKFTASDATPGDQFGYSVATTTHGALIGAPSRNEEQGAVYLFERSVSNTWSETGILSADDGTAGDRFGFSVEGVPTFAIVGAPGGEAAYVFEREYNNEPWVQTKLQLSTPNDSDDFGYTVDYLSVGGVLHVVVGAPGAAGGAVYLFAKTAEGWSQAATLTGSDTADGDRFGSAITTYINLIVVGAPLADTGAVDAGAVYTFGHDGTNWVEQPILTAPGAAAGDQYGIDVHTMDATNLIVGAPGRSQGAGAAFVYGRSTNWTFTKTIIGSDQAAGDAFGQTVGLSTGVAVVGAPNSDAAATDSGTVYSFRQSNGWTQNAKIISTPNYASWHFGSAVETDGSTAAVSALVGSDGGIAAQRVFVYAYQNDVWALQAILRSSNGADNAVYGNHIALDGDTLIVSGLDSIYVYSRNDGHWSLSSTIVPDDENLLVNAPIHVSGDVALIGNGVFRRTGDDWTREFEFSLDGTTLVSSSLDGERFAYVEHENGVSNDTRRLVIYEWNGTAWAQVDAFETTHPANFTADQPIELQGDWLAVGAPGEPASGTTQAGRVRVYGRQAGDWALNTELTGVTITRDDRFGQAVQLDGDMLAVNTDPIDPIRLHRLDFFSLLDGVWTRTHSIAATDHAWAAEIEFKDRWLFGGSSGTSAAGIGAGAVFVRRFVPAADLAITATSPGTLRADESLIYSYHVSNSGPDAATDIVVTNTLSSVQSAQLTASDEVSAQSYVIVCEDVDSSIVCNVGDLPPGYQFNWTLELSLNPYFAGTLTNDVTIAANESDPAQDNNDATVTTLVTAPLAPTAAPVIIAPLNNTSFPDTLPTFEWTEVENGVSYHIQIADNASFRPTLVDEADTALTYTPSVPLADGTYFWRVRAFSLIESPGPWSSPFTFTVDTVPPQNAPSPIAPADLAAVTNAQPAFSWSAVPDAVRYEMQLDTYEEPGAVVYSGSARNYTPPGPLLHATTYFWRVRALDAAGNPSAWSETYEVTINSPAGAVPFRTRYETSTPELRWNRVTYAVAYEIEVSRNSAFTLLVYHDDAVSGLSRVLNPLPDGTYYWRVRGQRSDGSWGPWSTVDTFSIDAPSP